MAQLINGKAVAELLRTQLTKTVAAMTVKPKLSIIIVGDRPDSASYVRMKTDACKEVGIISEDLRYPATVSQSELANKITELNNDPEVNGILVQLPLPSHINESALLELVSIDKDVDGFHTVNVGKLVQNDPSRVLPCTPAGCIYLLDHYNIPIEGKRAVVIGRSNIVGIPVSLLLMQRNATVTICHSRTQHLPEILKQADIVVAACGRARMVKAEWLKPGAAVIDVGVNQIEDSSRKSGYRLVGDVDFDAAKEVVGYISPVPRGVGPMTVAMLLNNVVLLKQRAEHINFSQQALIEE